MIVQSDKYYNYLKAISNNTMELEEINYSIVQNLTKEEKRLLRKICIKILNEIK